MQDEHCQQAEADCPEQFAEPLKEGAVTIDRLGRAEEDLQVTDEMPDDEAKEHQAGDSDDPFASDGRGAEAEEWVHKQGMSETTLGDIKSEKRVLLGVLIIHLI